MSNPVNRPVIVQPESYVERWELAELYPVRQPLEVEIGAGDGSFFIKWAALNPQTNLFAVERLLGRLNKIQKKSRRLGLQNVRGTRFEAAYLVRYLLYPGSVSAFHIYFPDPRPKRKHRGNRLINAPFAETLRAALRPGGIVYLRTDDTDYFEQMVAVFGENANFTAVPTPESLAAVLTDFEREFNARGIPTNRAAYQRRQ